MSSTLPAGPVVDPAGGAAPPAAAVERLRAAFAERSGRAPAGVWAAPAVVPLLGAHEDADGAALLVAVDTWGLVAAGRGADGRVQVLAGDGAPGASRYLAGVAHRLARALAVRELGGGEPAGPVARAALAAASAAPGTAVAVPAAPAAPWAVPLDLDRAGLQLLLLESGQHDSGTPAGRRSAGGDRSRARDDDGPGSAGSRRLRQAAAEDLGVAAAVRALEAGDPGAVGELMTASHTSCRVTLRLSSVQVEATVGAALHAGALGARLVLPAYWGPVVALVPADRVDDVAAAAQGTAASLGFPVPRATRLAPGGAAHRAW